MDRKTFIEAVTLADGESDEALNLLEAIEVAFRRMIAGIFRFVFVQLPTWIHDLFQELFEWLNRFVRYAVKFSIRLGRALFFASAWGLLVFFPLVATLGFSGFDFQTLKVLAMAWAGTGLVGSVWGLNRWWRQRQATGSDKRLPLKNIWKANISFSAAFVIIVFCGMAGLLIAMLAGLIPF